MKKFVERHHIAIICILILIIVTGYFPSILKLNILKTIGWKRFTSKRVPLSFSYPPKLPVTQCESIISEPPESILNDELIYFASDCNKPSNFGYIKVDHNIWDEECSFVRGCFTSCPQVSEKVKVGNRIAYKTSDFMYTIYTEKYKYTIVKSPEAGQIMLDKMDAFLESFKF